MIPSAGDVARIRLLVVGVLRALAVLLLVLGLRAVVYLCVYLFAWMTTGGFSAGGTWLWTYVLQGLAEGGAGFLVWLAAPWIARRAVVAPDHAVCPRCEYRLSRLQEPRCPECGLDLEPEFLAGERQQGRPATHATAPPTIPARPPSHS